MALQFEQALKLVLEGVKPLETENVMLMNALGRVLAEDVLAGIDQPPFPRSPLDGYALRALDSKGASRTTPLKLQVIDKVYAGGFTDVTIGEGQCVRVMTGSILAPGSDCVIRQERTDEGENTVLIYEELAPFDNYIHKGSDFAKGTLLLARGLRMDAYAAFIAAAAGVNEVVVVKKPKVTVLSTGDELVAPGQALPPGKIYNSNLIYLTARLEEMGMDVIQAETCGDDEEIITGALGRALKEADLLITTGGVSVGQKDLIPDIIAGLGAKTIFHGIAMKPGMPTLFARHAGVPILALSGNPFAAAAVFELLARPLLAQLSADSHLAATRKKAVLQTAFPKASPGRRFIRGKFQDGQVTLPEGHSSSQILSLLGCNCFIDVQAGTASLEAGETVEVVML